MRGFGTVVTGTLAGGALTVGDTAELRPGGQRARIRGLQSFGEAAAVVRAGARCAVNLQGVAREEIARGTLLTAPDALAETQTLDAEIAWLAVAPPLGPKPVSVELLVGTATRRAHAAPIGAECPRTGCARLRAHPPRGRRAPAAAGDASLRASRAERGSATLGGGRVLDAHPPQRRRSDPALLADLAQLTGADAATAVRVRIERAGFAGCEQEVLRRETGLTTAALDARSGLEGGPKARPKAACCSTPPRVVSSSAACSPRSTSSTSASRCARARRGVRCAARCPRTCRARPSSWRSPARRARPRQSPTAWRAGGLRPRLT
jgi:selenocysteine-specific elongation factor